jgi:Protein of unknown function (DUF3138)
MFKVKALVIALAAASIALPVTAQTNADILKELQALRARVDQLEAQLKAEQEKPKAELAEFNRIAVKTEALEDAMEAQGLKGLKMSGGADPTFMFNRAQKTSSFQFLNNFTNGEVYAFDNSYFGMAWLDLQKEMDNGTRWRMTLAPHKSAQSGYNIGSIIHEASVSIPIDGLQKRLIAGVLPDWSGYEYLLPHQNKFITHNLLFDFAAPTYYAGVGAEITDGKWIYKGMLGNVNANKYGSGQRTPLLSYRVDYSKGEFNGFGFAGQHGKIANATAGGSSMLHALEVDGYFIRGPLTAQGQVAFGQQKAAAFNGGNAQWWGVSGLAAYKVTPRFELMARADYLNNRKNGGGTYNVFFTGNCFAARDASGALAVDASGATINDQTCADGRNGFGPGMAYVADADGNNGQWEVADANKGSNRYALSLGMSYLLNQFTTIKAEYRYDASNNRVFQYVGDGSYKKNNHTFGVSTVVTF